MRLIDADAFKNTLIDLAIEETSGTDKRFVMYGNRIIRGMAAVVDDEPTIDPVRHGNWTVSKEHFYAGDSCKEWTNYYCSNCDAPSDCAYDYCPNCGSRNEVIEHETD